MARNDGRTEKDLTTCGRDIGISIPAACCLEKSVSAAAQRREWLDLANDRSDGAASREAEESNMAGIASASVAPLGAARRPPSRAAMTAPQADLESAADMVQVHRLLGAIYEGPVESPPWKTALQIMREQLGAASVTLTLRPTAPRSPGSGALMLRGGDACEVHFKAFDPLISLPEDDTAARDESIGGGAPKCRSGRDDLKPISVGHLLVVDIDTEEGIVCRLSLVRPRAGRPFSDEHKAACRLILPHLRRAIHLHARLDFLECERRLLAGSVRRMQVGIISFAQDGAMLEANQEARRLLTERDGLRLSGSTLCVDSNQESRSLHLMIQAALGRSAVSVSGGETEGTVQAMAITRPSGRAKLGVIVRSLPLKPWSERTRRPAVVVFVRDPESNAGQPSLELVRRLFGLTRMQAQLALLLAEGLTLDEASEQMGVRRNTARTHLRAIFSKTGVTRQTMLVRLVLNSVLTLGLEADCTE